MGGELWRLGAADLAAAIREKRASSREVVQAHLDRIEATNPHLNAITRVLADEALAAADAADAAVARGAALGALHGVPMTVKENIDLCGSATTQGIVAMREAIPPVDAPHIEGLKRAGAIPIARTNLPDFGLRWHTDNDLHGATLNPWDASRTPGGSSGGEAVALATGMTPLGNGNDYGGSVRVPSQFCGTAALRPTFGRIPQASALAPMEPRITGQLFAVQGPMARHVRDLRTAFEAMSVPSARDPWFTPAPLRGPPPAQPRRVAVAADPGGEGVDDEVAAGVRRAADALADAGYAVEEVDPPAVRAAAEGWSQLVFAEIRTGLRPLLEGIASKDAKGFLDLALEAVPELDLESYMGGLAERHGIARQWAQFFERFPLVLGPVCTEPAFAVGSDVRDREAVAKLIRSMRLVVLVNYLGLPAAAVAAGVWGGLPQGVQIIGPRYREDLCLDAAQAVEERLGTLAPIDPIA